MDVGGGIGVDPSPETLDLGGGIACVELDARPSAHLRGGVAGVDAAELLEPRGAGTEQQREVLDVRGFTAPALELPTWRQHQPPLNHLNETIPRLELGTSRDASQACPAKRTCTISFSPKDPKP